MTSFPVVLGVVVGGVVDVVVVRLGLSLNGSTLSSTAIKEVFFLKKRTFREETQGTRCSPEKTPKYSYFSKIVFSSIISKQQFYNYGKVFTILKNNFVHKEYC